MKIKILVFLYLMYGLQANALTYETNELEDLLSRSVLDYYSDVTGLNLSIDFDRYSYERVDSDLYHAYMESEALRSHPSFDPRFIPFELDSSDMLKVAAASATAVIVFANDEEIKEFSQANRNDLLDSLAVYGESVGGMGGVTAIGAGVIIGVVLDNEQIKRVSVMAAKTTLVSGMVTRALKMSFHRERPRKADSAYEFHGPAFHNQDVAFPSGHTTQAFAIATVIAHEGRQYSPMIPFLAYSAAAIGGWSRVNDNAHWASDVVAGALIGHLVAKNIINANSANKGFLITPSLHQQGEFMVHLSYIERHSKNQECGEGLEGRDKFRECLLQNFRR